MSKENILKHLRCPNPMAQNDWERRINQAYNGKHSRWTANLHQSLLGFAINSLCDRCEELERNAMTATKPKDGGAAFPRPFSRDKWTDVDYLPQEGMTLRDWFAGLALQGELASQEGEKQYSKYFNVNDCRLIAEWSYLVADAMLARRGEQ